MRELRHLAVVGSRTIANPELVRKKIVSPIIYEIQTYHIETSMRLFVPFILVSGGADGVDKFSEIVNSKIPEQQKTIEQRVPTIIIPEWKRYGRAAGYFRNKDIIAFADYCLAFWDGQSKGTVHSIELAKSKGIPLEVHTWNNIAKRFDIKVFMPNEWFEFIE